uniref:Uncharacterized protein n=1 Tax=Phytophthora ramorum TaxID=164328 RepID=H3GDU1_PHYRM
MNIANLLCAPPESQGLDSSTTKKPSSKVGMQFVLCDDSDNQNEEEPPAQRRSEAREKRPAKKSNLGKRPLPAPQSTTTTLSVIPDKDRKRSYRLSAKQRLRRLDNDALESQMYNLTLDVNNLKQQVRYLQECRDLYTTRMTVARQHAQGQAVGMVALLFRLFCDETCGTNEAEPNDRSLFLSRIHERLSAPSAGGRDGVPHFMQTWRSFKVLFTHRSYTVKSIQLVGHVGPQQFAEDKDPCDTVSTDVVDEARQRCGPSGGCVVESRGEFSGRLKRDTIVAIAPRLLQDEPLVARLIGQKFSCPLRMVAYFNADGQLVDHVAELDVIAALNALIGRL